MQGAQHPELPAEQAYLDAAYLRLEQIRDEAAARAATHAAAKTTAFQAVYERDVAVRTALERARSMQIGDEALCFGRTDHENGDRFYIGRRAVSDERHEPMVIDWRVPSAEPFFRATGLHPLGLTMRRHLLCEGRRLVAVEDEEFGENSIVGDVQGPGALSAAMERPRTGHMRDIVATLQAEQDEVIRDELPGILAVQGGPGTGKTAVALHRAAFLLFTHRRVLERQGMLVLGPNKRFLRYIDQVLPALGEGGVRLATLGELGPRVSVQHHESWDVAHLKGDIRMARVIERAVQRRIGRIDTDAIIMLDQTRIPLYAKELNEIVEAGKRNRRRYNTRRAMLQSIVVDRLYERYVASVKDKHGDLADIMLLRRREGLAALREHPDVIKILDQVWPALSPQVLVGDLLSSRARMQDAARGILKARELDVLVRHDARAWTADDIPLLDEASTCLGTVSARKRSEDDDDPDEIGTYGHIVVDEAQDLSPMALRMISRRTRVGSITLVGDLAQAASPTAPSSWEGVVAHLPQRGPFRVRELTVNYRTPGPAMAVAARVLKTVAPEIVPPSSARVDGEAIARAPGDPAATVARLVEEQRARPAGTMVVIAARSDMSMLAPVVGDDEFIALLAVEEAKGLEFDHVVIVEPARVVAEATQGLRALYIAITRATQRVTLAHATPLPPELADALG